MRRDDEFCDDSDGLIELGEALWREWWITPMSKALGVNERTIRRWRDGESRIPVTVLQELRVMLALRKSRPLDRIAKSTHG